MTSVVPETDSLPGPGREGRRAGGGVVASWVRLAAVTLVGVLQMPLLFRHLPPAELGVWYLLFAIAVFVNLSDLGLPSAFGRAVSYLWGREQVTGGTPADVPGTYRSTPLPVLYASAFVATALLSVAFALVALPAALLYFGQTFTPAAVPAALIPSLLLFLGGVVLNMVAAIPGACLSGYGDVAWDSATRTAATVIGFGLMWALLPSHPGLRVLCAIYLAQGAVLLVSSHVVLALRHRVPLAEMRVDRSAIHRLYAESAPIFVTRLGLWLVQESNLLIAGYFLGSGRVPDFAVLRQIAAIGAGIVTAIPIAVSPHVAAAHAAGDTGKVRSLFTTTVRYALVLNVLWTVGLLLWTPEVLSVLVGEGHFLGYAVLVPVVAGGFLELHGSTHGFFVWALGRWPFAPHVVAGGVLNAILGSAGCALFSFTGLAWGSLISQSATIHWSVAVHGLAQMGVSIGAYFRKTLVPALAFAAALAALAAGAKALTRELFFGGSPASSAWPATVPYALVGISLTTLLAAVLAWWLVLTTDDRAYFLRISRIRTSLPDQR